MKFVLGSLLLTLGFHASASAQLDEKVADRLYQSSTVLDELVKAPDGGVPKELLKRAECVAVVPNLKKAALGVGGQYGRGVVSCRKDQGKGTWGPPSMIAVSGGSFGLQLGGQSNDIVMLFMTADSIPHLLRDKIILGGDVSAAIGPKGRTASAETNATMRAEILTYSRSRGVFAGISLKGAAVTPDKEANKNLYSRDIQAKELLVDGKVAIPQQAQKFIDALTKFTAGK